MHTLILGMSGTGKSALAKQLGTRLRQKGKLILAYNPTKETGYTRKDSFGCIAADYETHNAQEFEAKVREVVSSNQHPNVYLIVDEAHEFFTRADCNSEWIATRGRHYGINVIGITQRAAKINVTFRGQCSNVYIFRCNLTDTKFVLDEFYHTGLREKDLSLDDGKFLKIQGKDVSYGDISQF